MHSCSNPLHHQRWSRNTSGSFRTFEADSKSVRQRASLATEAPNSGNMATLSPALALADKQFGDAAHKHDHSISATRVTSYDVQSGSCGSVLTGTVDCRINRSRRRSAKASTVRPVQSVAPSVIKGLMSSRPSAVTTSIRTGH